MPKDDEAATRRRERNRAKNAAKRENDPDAIICPLCEHQIKTTGKTEYGSDTPYKGKSLITHFKRDHGTNALGIDKILGVPPGTTQVCSPALIEGTFRPAGARGALALATKNAMDDATPKNAANKLTDLEDAAIAAGIK